MNIRQLLSWFFTAMFFLQSARADDCQDQKALLLQSFQSMVAPAEILKKIVNPKDKILILAESHYTESQGLEPKLIEMLKKQNAKFNCVYLEFSDRKDLFPGDPYYALMVRAEAQGMKVKFIDKKKTIFPNDLFKNVENRNKSMAVHIAKTFQNKTCRAGVVIVGKAHVYSKLMGKKITSLPTALQTQFQLKSKSINLLNLDVEDVRDEPTIGVKYKYTPNKKEIFSKTCGVDLPDLSEASGFFSKPWPASVEYEPGAGGSLNDFDATILLP